MKSMSDFFVYGEREILDQAEEFHEILTHLRYEGKASQGKNVKAAIKAVRGLDKIIRKHRGLQEKILFPFLASHIPKHESVIHFLRADHQAIQKSRQKLVLSLRRLSKKIGSRLEEGRIQETGVYLICLLRHHMSLENKCIHKAVQTELRKDEKSEVKGKMNRWLMYQGET